MHRERSKAEQLKAAADEEREKEGRKEGRAQRRAEQIESEREVYVGRKTVFWLNQLGHFVHKWSRRLRHR